MNIICLTDLRRVNQVMTVTCELLVQCSSLQVSGVGQELKTSVLPPYSGIANEFSTDYMSGEYTGMFSYSRNCVSLKQEALQYPVNNMRGKAGQSYIITISLSIHTAITQMCLWVHSLYLPHNPITTTGLFSHLISSKTLANLTPYTKLAICPDHL